MTVLFVACCVATCSGCWWGHLNCEVLHACMNTAFAWFQRPQMLQVVVSVQIMVASHYVVCHTVPPAAFWAALCTLGSNC